MPRARAATSRRSTRTSTTSRGGTDGDAVGRLRHAPAPGVRRGPSPERLVLGSEGTWGSSPRRGCASGRRPAAAPRRARGSLASRRRSRRRSLAVGAFPSNCRVLDAKEAMLERRRVDGGSVLLLAFESADHPYEAWMTRPPIVATEGGSCRGGAHLPKDGRDARGADAAPSGGRRSSTRRTCRAGSSSSGSSWTPSRRRARGTASRRCTRGDTDGQEAMRERAAADHSTCRFTHVYPDGPAPYFTFLAPGRSSERGRAVGRIKTAVSDALVAAGGPSPTTTPSGASTVPATSGRCHRCSWSLFAIKRVLDPAGVLNPGVLIDA